MRELREILARLDRFAPKEKGAVLATVIDVKGSSYRLPGAKMLIEEDGNSFGTVSGGCLEADVLTRARSVSETLRPALFVYDTSQNLDSVFNFNMGCRGIIKILLEPIQNNEYIDFVRTCYSGKRGVAHTILRGDEIESRKYFYEDSTQISNLPPIVVESFSEQRSKYVENSNGIEFADYISPPVSLEIFGGGADAVPLAEIATSVGWLTTIIDHRSALVNQQRFPFADRFIITRPENLSEINPVSKDSFCVVMTHNFDTDREIVRYLIQNEPRYIGILGPRSRTKKILSDIGLQNEKAMFAPIGLDIGAREPEMIALSIIAEIQCVISGREGGFLKNRNLSIYDR